MRDIIEKHQQRWAFGFTNKFCWMANGMQKQIILAHKKQN